MTTQQELTRLSLPELMESIKSQIKVMSYTALIASRAMVDCTYDTTPVVKDILAIFDAEIEARKVQILKVME